MIINRELTQEEKETVISTVTISDTIVYFQNGDEGKYTEYLAENVRLQNEYLIGLNKFIQTL